MINAGSGPSLTSEMKVAQVVCNNLLGGFLRAQLDSTREKDVPFPSGDDCVAFLGCLYVRHADDTWNRRQLRAVRQTQVTHGGTLQRCIYGTNRTRPLRDFADVTLDETSWKRVQGWGVNCSTYLSSCPQTRALNKKRQNRKRSSATRCPSLIRNRAQLC